jgi:hypothetical protein
MSDNARTNAKPHVVGSLCFDMDIRVMKGNMRKAGFYEGAVRFRKQSCREIAITN